MKKSWILLLLLCILLTACQGTGKTAEMDIEQQADQIIGTYDLTTGNRYSSLSQVEGEYLDDELIRSYYGDPLVQPDFTQVEAYAVYIDESRPTLPSEFGIFRMTPDADKELFKDFLQARIDLKLFNAVAYPTMDTEPLETAVVMEKGDYIWYCVVKDANDQINTQLEQALSG